jgi:hypothetical protein
VKHAKIETLRFVAAYSQAFTGNFRKHGHVVQKLKASVLKEIIK